MSNSIRLTCLDFGKNLVHLHCFCEVPSRGSLAKSYSDNQSDLMAQIDDGCLFWSPPLAVFDGIFAEFIELQQRFIDDGHCTAVSNLMGASICLMEEASKYEVDKKYDDRLVFVPGLKSFDSALPASI